MSKWDVYCKIFHGFGCFLAYFKNSSVGEIGVTNFSSFANGRVVSTIKEGLRVHGMYAVC